jgi:hypothetical protein
MKCPISDQWAFEHIFSSRNTSCGGCCSSHFRLQWWRRRFRMTILTFHWGQKWSWICLIAFLTRRLSMSASTTFLQVINSWCCWEKMMCRRLEPQEWTECDLDLVRFSPKMLPEATTSTIVTVMWMLFSGRTVKMYVLRPIMRQLPPRVRANGELLGKRKKLVSLSLAWLPLIMQKWVEWTFWTSWSVCIGFAFTQKSGTGELLTTWSVLLAWMHGGCFFTQGKCNLKSFPCWIFCEKFQCAFCGRHRGLSRDQEVNYLRSYDSTASITGQWRSKSKRGVPIVRKILHTNVKSAI